ncbi:hypothetical protein CICLE_v10004058mg [Citrus x clementina]|uniref:Uncharacterized protein n=1 Tax=Citrus clementina TaxID=85681 RepID=V4SYG3_CITCL|nr:hypothetical protein CICLE_v10004058mg [Citrus x clementina]
MLFQYKYMLKNISLPCWKLSMLLLHILASQILGFLLWDTKMRGRTPLFIAKLWLHFLPFLHCMGGTHPFFLVQ